MLEDVIEEAWLRPGSFKSNVYRLPSILGMFRQLGQVDFSTWKEAAAGQDFAEEYNYRRIAGTDDAECN